MEKQKLEELRDRVRCAAVLERAGFAIDVKESTRKAVKYRRDAEIVIVIHGGREGSIHCPTRKAMSSVSRNIWTT